MRILGYILGLLVIGALMLTSCRSKRALDSYQGSGGKFGIDFSRKDSYSSSKRRGAGDYSRKDSYSSSGKRNKGNFSRKDSYSTSGKRNTGLNFKDSYSNAGGRRLVMGGRDSYSTKVKKKGTFWSRLFKKKPRRDSYNVSRKRKIIRKRKPPQGIKPY